jgi:hypothetical protein
MKNSKFIELLNLYVDHQISPAEAALLDAEIQQNPERRKIYREYCQMQKACAILSENFRTEAPVADKVVDHARAPRRLGFATYAMGFAAAAACIALVVVKSPVKQPTSLASSLTVAADTSAPAVAVVPAVETTRPPLHPAFPGILREEKVATAALASTERVPLDWMNQVQLERVKVEDLWFSNRPELQTSDLTLRNVRPSQGQVESTAFIFAK